ncbi:sigma-70 family RNA polymerase sigma factor [Singulisphaera sp. Ch08]|uniref:Sigma-70 family RNA polymerase sigma factor n=1 Tax=Singulisphaera sp. Ch08 TaxID=3120278 RepID=A0AAU7CNG5_9BACT
MSKGQHDTASRHVRMLFNVGTVGGLTDGQLLEQFTSQGVETAELAFTALIERHGPMVLRVCGSILRDPDQAHDAFQATFLVLVRRAGSLWVRDSLGPWLHQVAYRVASCARSAATRRRRHERRAAEMASPGIREEAQDDLGVVLHDEVNRLSGGCRAAVVLCYFEGLSPAQAARQLGCPVGTIQSRLARGRERLRSRLTRRGFAPALGAIGVGVTAEAAPASLPATLVEMTVRAVLPLSGAEVATGSVIQLTQGVLRSMLIIKLRTVAATLITIATLTTGAYSMLQKAPAPQPQSNPDQIQAPLEAQGGDDAGQRTPPSETGPPPLNLTWTEIAPTERLQIIEQLATQSKGNYEKIKTWQGTYSYVLRQRLNERFVTELLAGAQRLAQKPPPPAKAEALMQEFDSVLTFAIDLGSDAIYRDLATKRMRFLRIGTDEEVKIPNVGTSDHRSIVTPKSYFVFPPKERATSAFLPDHPEAQMKRRAEHFPVQEARSREAGVPDPRAFFKFDAGNSFWTLQELYARAFRGELGAEQKKGVEQRLNVGQADGPGGRWYRQQMGLGDQNGAMLWITTLWSPQAGYNPVSMVVALDQPDGKLQSRIEWTWKLLDGIYVPATIKELVYESGGLSKDQQTTLKECALNRPLAPHQFDERGLGLSDGDLVLNHLERVAYIIKGGEPVKLANFGEPSVLRPARAKPAPTPTGQPRPQPADRIYTTASLETDAAGRPIRSVVAVNPESGDVTKVFDNSPGRLRISPDGRSMAYVAGEPSANLPPSERMRQSLWTRPLASSADPKRVARLDGATGGEMPIWSPDSKQIILNISTRDESRKQWVFETFRINADGTGRVPLNIPAQDSVQDWSSDGAWIVTASSRNAKIGWQLYLMRPDGKDQRQLTEGGNPFYVRFSPDGRRLLYSDGPAEQRRGIWVVDLDGKDRRRILPTGKGTASACWSPDGQRIAVAISGSQPEEHGRLEIVNLDGTHHTLLTLPSQEIANMPDWR